MKPKKKVVVATPCLVRPTDQYLAALEASVPLVEAAGWECCAVYEVGCPYISAARSTMLRKALDAKADVIVFVDYDLSWDPADLLTLIETKGEVVAGVYRYKDDEAEKYMGYLTFGENNSITLRQPDGCIAASHVPAGFLKVTKEAVDRFMIAYPDLCFGPMYAQAVDLFNHGAHKGIWWGEDYAFSRRWREIGGEIWLRPDLNITHHAGDKAYPGNFMNYLRGRFPAAFPN